MYDTQAFHQRNVKMISIHLYKHNTGYVKLNDLNGTKLKILKFTSKTDFHELKNSVELCRLERNYNSECNMNFLRSNTHDLTRNRFVPLHT